MYFWLIVALLTIPFRLVGQYNAGLNQIKNGERIGLLFAYQQQLPGHITRIIHFGDSHVQSGFFGEAVKRGLQATLGNSGPGFVFPYRLAMTNGNKDFHWTSANRWLSGRNTDIHPLLRTGIGGWTIAQQGPTFSIKFDATNGVKHKNAFRSIQVFQGGETTYQISVSADNLIYQSPIVSTSSLTWLLPQETTSFKLDGLKTGSGRGSIFGLSLENGEPGILYHTIGVNGSRFDNFAREGLFAQQSQDLHPDIFIISLGTNEAQATDLSQETFKRSIDILVKQLLLSNPNAEILFTTPMASFRRAYRYRKVRRRRRRSVYLAPNPVVGQVRDAIISYAGQNNFAVWDLYSIVGGEEAAAAWKKSGLMGNDGVHFSQQGYELQGRLLYEALLKCIPK